MKDRVHKKHTTKFTTTSNKILQDSRLSYEAIGVFMYLWSMPDDWQVMVKQVMKHNNSSEYSVRKALRELRDFGYMKWIRTQGYFIYDMCEDGTFHCGDIQHNESHYSDSQHNDIYIQNNNINKTINETNTASGFSSSQSSYSETPNSSVCKESLHTQEQKNEEFNQFWEEYGKKVKKLKAEESFKKALSKASFEEIMHGVKEYQRYLKVANEKKQWLGKAEPHKWLNEKRWNDDYDDLIKQEYKKQGKPLPVQQKSPEKQQEDVKMKEHIQERRKSVLSRLNAKELEFTYFLRKHLINDFSSPFHSVWIENLVFSCKNGIALIGVESEIGIRLNWEKLQGILSRELQGKFEFTEIKMEIN